MNFYDILSLVAGRKIPGAVKVLGLAAMHLMRRRIVGVYLDPTTGCNLRCRMCYFSNPEYDTRARNISPARLAAVERVFYRRALKLQIGCGTEPTIYRDLSGIVSRAKEAGVPFISLTTNGQLLAAKPDRLKDMVAAGLDEITLSAHGTKAETYEYLMPGASFDKFRRLITILAELKKQYPKFSIRLNFTFNSMNISDLTPDNFWALWDDVQPDIIQLRPVQDMGGSEWSDYDTAALKTDYDNTVGRLVLDCHERGIKVLVPDKDQLNLVDDEQDWASAAVEDVCYCYISPDAFYKPDFCENSDTFESYHRRAHTVRRLVGSVLSRKGRRRNASKKLNYTVK